MKKTAFERILDQICASSPLSSDEIRGKMQQAMIDAMRDPEPAVQKMWDSIPRKGDTPTLEEFMDYLIDKNMLQP